jgi:hypothetical protein
MTEHDKALHQAVGEARACTPAQVRNVVGRLALSGALGPEAKAREADRSRAERTSRTDMELLLLLHLLESCGRIWRHLPPTLPAGRRGRRSPRSRPRPRRWE